jgi:hypothetical protein
MNIVLLLIIVLTVTGKHIDHSTFAASDKLILCDRNNFHKKLLWENKTGRAVHLALPFYF